MDGTFSTIPPQFLQLYTVHGFQQGRNVGAYSLLTNKWLETYSELLTQIQIRTNHVNPHSIMIYFEQAMIGALRNVYPLVPQGLFIPLIKKHLPESTRPWPVTAVLRR